MADDVARLVIQADTDDVMQAATEVDRLRRSMESARDAVMRAAPGWEMQARGLADLSAQLAKAESAYERVARAAQNANRAAAGGGGGGGGMDPGRAGRMSYLGMSVAQTAQDAYYNPIYAVNNVMGMAQMSGGVKNLGKDLAELGGTVATAALRFTPLNVAIAGAGVALGGITMGLKSAELGWGDFLDVMGNTTPVKAVTTNLQSLWGSLANSQAGQAVDSVWDSVKGIVHDTANIALGWDAATEAVKRHKRETELAAENAMQAGITSGNLRGDFGRDMAGAGSSAALGGVMERLNRAFAEGRLSEEDYAAALERGNAIRQQLVQREGEAAREAAAAETALVAERLREAEATRQAAIASRNAAEAAALEAEQKKNLAQFDRRVDRRADLYGSAFGGAIAQAQLRAAQRGEDAGATDERLRGQLAARMHNIPPGMRDAVITQILQRSRMMAEDQAVMMGFQGDMIGTALGAQAVRGDQRTLIGQMNRQAAIRMGTAMGINVDAYGKQIESVAPTEKQLDAAKTMEAAVKEFRDVIRNVQVTI